MSINRNRQSLRLNFAPAQMGEGEADYSYDQWRQQQIRQMEQNYARVEGRVESFAPHSAPV